MHALNSNEDYSVELQKPGKNNKTPCSRGFALFKRKFPEQHRQIFGSIPFILLRMSA